MGRDGSMVKPFEGLLGNNCELRLIEFLLPLEGMDFNITELAEEVGISRPTANRIVKKFVDWGLMKGAQKKGGVNYYEINPSSAFFGLFEQLNNYIIEKMLDEETLYQIHDYREQHTLTLKSASEPKLKSEPLVIPSFEEIWSFSSISQRGPATSELPLVVMTNGGGNFSVAD